MTERKFLATIPFKPKFYILDHKEQRVIAIKEEKELGYDGVVIYCNFNAYKSPQYFFEASSFYIGKEFIQKKISEYDFTNNTTDAVMFCKATKP